MPGAGSGDFTDLITGSYSLDQLELPPALYIASARQGDRDGFTDGVDISTQPSIVETHFRRGGCISRESFRCSGKTRTQSCWFSNTGIAAGWRPPYWNVVGGCHRSGWSLRASRYCPRPLPCLCFTWSRLVGGPTPIYFHVWIRNFSHPSGIAHSR